MLQRYLHYFRAVLLSVLIVTYKAPAFAEQTLASVRRAMRGLDAELLLRDNSSPENNIGFGAANNELLRQAKGDFVLFLNPDILLPEHALAESISYLRSDARFGALGVRMIDGSGRFLPESKRNKPVLFSSFAQLVGKSKGYYSSLSESESGEVAVLPGAFFLTRRKLMTELGAFDENFFMYGEDIDLSVRVKASGRQNIYYPRVSIIHFKGESTSKNDPAYRERFFGAMQVYARKHYGKLSAAFSNAGIAVAKKLFGKNKSREARGQQIPKHITLVAENERESATAKAICERDNISTTFDTLRDNITGAVCFCIDSLTLHEVINYVSDYPGGEYYFHLAGTASIVGSADKNGRGIAIM